MKLCTIADYDTPHSYAVYRRAVILGEETDMHHVWHPLRYPFGKWIPKNSIALRVIPD